MVALNTAAVVDGVARVVAGAISGHIFAAGTTASVTSAAPLVVPVADDFTEGGLPAVTCALGTWTSTLQTTNERMHIVILGVVWRPRVPLGEVVAQLYGDRDAIADAVLAHSKAFLAEPYIQSVILEGGPGIVERSLGDPESPRMFLTLPFTVNVVCNRPVNPQPA